MSRADIKKVLPEATRSNQPSLLPMFIKREKKTFMSNFPNKAASTYFVIRRDEHARRRLGADPACLCAAVRYFSMMPCV
jgi:hypothetical protein